MVVWYLVPSLDPELLVAVGWEPVLGSFVARVEGIPTRALLDPDRLTVAWFGSRQGELQTVDDLQEAIGEYAVLGSDLRAALEADRTGRSDQPNSPAGLGGLQLVASNRSHKAGDQRSPDRFMGRTLVGLALLVGMVVGVVMFLLPLSRSWLGPRTFDPAGRRRVEGVSPLRSADCRSGASWAVLRGLASTPGCPQTERCSDGPRPASWARFSY
jgi:hypothetical protein